MAEATAARMEVGDLDGNVVLTISSAVANTPIPFVVPPNVAAELAENIARAAFIAHHGHAKTITGGDMNYLLTQYQSKVTEQMRIFLARRLEIMLNSLRENKTWSNEKLAAELVDTVLTKVA